MTEPTTPRYAAFLRGINLGRRRVTGEELAVPFRNLGFTEVDTFLASGNVVFEAPEPVDGAALTARIEAELEACLGFSADAFLRSSAELAAIVARTPFPPAELERSAGKLQVMLLRSEPDPPRIAAVLAHVSAEDRLAVHGTELYWLPAGNMSASALDLNALGRLVGSNTMRTANTLARLHGKYFARV